MKVERQVWNSVRIISGMTQVGVETRYEILTNMVLSYGGRIHGSQYTHSKAVDNDDIDIITVYFEIPKENKEEFEKELPKQ